MAKKFERIKYNPRGNKYEFLLVPKPLISNTFFSELSLEAIVLYSLMLERTALSYQNQWIDENGDIYIYYSTNEAMKQLRIKRTKFFEARKELSDMGLIEVQSQIGMKQSSSKIYVCDFLSGLTEEELKQDAENTTNSDVQNTDNDVQNANNDVRNTDNDVQNANNDVQNADSDVQNADESKSYYKNKTNKIELNENNISSILTNLAEASESEKVNALVEYIEPRIEKSLGIDDRTLLSELVSTENTELLVLSINDNIFRRERFGVQYVKRQLRSWKRAGIKNPIAARNIILDNKIKNIAEQAKIKALSKNPNMSEEYLEQYIQEYVAQSEAGSLRDLIESITEAYDEQAFGYIAMRVESNYAQDVEYLDYLRPEIKDYIQKNYELSSK